VPIDVGWATATGGRADNQDRCRAAPTWAVVSDGAGGHRGGARAAELVVAAAEGVLERSGRSTVDLVVERANTAVRAARAADPSVAAMAATLTLALAVDLAPDRSRWLVANVGDSPAWRVTTEASAHRLTRDHNVAAELQRAGALSADEAREHPGRHHITRAIGIEPTALADVVEIELAAGDALVLASDGLEVLGPPTLARLLAGATAGTATAHQSAELLVEAALQAQARDNVTVVVLRHLPSFGHVPNVP
jgi:serine/threonine protein phosphatase PrpC